MSAGTKDTNRREKERGNTDLLYTRRRRIQTSPGAAPHSFVRQDEGE